VKLTKTKLKWIIREEYKRFTGGSVDIEPMEPEDQEIYEEAYYKLYNFLINDSDLPGDNPSDKLLSALSWIARFELGKEEEEGGELDMGEYTRLPSATRQSVDRSTAIARGEDY